MASCSPTALLSEIASRPPPPPFACHVPERTTVIRAAAAWTPALAAPAPATVVLVGGTIASVSWGTSAGPAADLAAASAPGEVIVVTTGAGATLLPGLIDAHAHPTFMDSFNFDVSADVCAISTARNLATILRSGFTSVHSAAACKLGVEAVARDMVHGGALEGPRWRTAGPELTPTGGLGAGTVLSPFESDCFGMVCDGPGALTAAIAECVSYGVDAVKINVSGEQLVGDDVASTFERAEVAAAVAAARAAGVRIAAHSRGSRSVADALAAGVDVIYHCDYAGHDGVPALLDAVSPGGGPGCCGGGAGLLLAPSLGFLVALADDPAGLPGDPLFGAAAKLRASVATHRALLAEGGSRAAAMGALGIGGDYGFPPTPHGTAARDVAVFTSLLGATPLEALRCATGVGARFMGLPVGHLHEGFAADVIVVAGDPTRDPAALQGDRVRAVISNGRFAVLRGGGGVCGIPEPPQLQRGAQPHPPQGREEEDDVVPIDARRRASAGAALEPWLPPTLSDAPVLRGEVPPAGWATTEAVRAALRSAFRSRFPAVAAAAVEEALATSLSERRRRRDPAAGAGNVGAPAAAAAYGAGA